MRIALTTAALAAILVAHPAAARNERRPPAQVSPEPVPSPLASGPMEFWTRPFALEAGHDPTFKPGQVWQYRTRPNEERSLIVVCRVDAAAHRGTIVHVQVTGIRIRKRGTVLGFVTAVQHLPMKREALVTSVTTLEREDGDCKDFDAPYWQWRREFVSGSGRTGVYAASVAESLDFLARSPR